MGAQPVSESPGPRLGLVVALAAEAKALGVATLCPESAQDYGRDDLLVVSGMGADAARRAGQTLLTAGAEALVSVGTAGALQPDLQPGDLCIPEQILWQSQNFPTAPVLVESFQRRFPTARAGALLSLPQVLSDPQEKAKYAEQALAVDMESGVLAALAAQQGVPVLALRVVIDTHDTRLPDAVRYGVDAYGRPQPLRFLRYLLRRPQDLPQLLRLGQQMQKAQATLRQLRRAIQMEECACAR